MNEVLELSQWMILLGLKKCKWCLRYGPKNPAPEKRHTSALPVFHGNPKTAEILNLGVKNSNNFHDAGSNSLKIGRHLPRTYRQNYAHDFIELFQKDITRIFDICSPLYLQGYSLQEVSNQTGFPWTTIRNQLVKGGMTLRPNKSVSADQVLRQSFKSSTPPPFGYLYLEGRLQKDLKEFPVLQIIWKQWKLGQSATAITDYLNKKKFKTRNNKEWKRTTVLNILERFENKSIVL